MRLLLPFLFTLPTFAQPQPAPLSTLLKQSCHGCHNATTAKGGLDLTALPFDLKNHQTRDRWIRVHDRIDKGEMPPKGVPLPPPQRTALLKNLAPPLRQADHADIAANGRGPMRRLNRDEYEQNLRDLLQLPHLDIRDMLPEDREAHHFTKVSDTLDMSRVQLTAYLDAAEAALRQAMVTEKEPPAREKYRVFGAGLFISPTQLNIPEAMFFLKDGKRLQYSRDEFQSQSKSGNWDPTVEMGLFRSPGWPYAAYPQKLVAKRGGEYRVRFSARAMRQSAHHQLTPALNPVPFTFRSRRPTNQDIAEDVKATGGIIDILPGGGVYETTVLLPAGQTLEYGLLGLPAPAVDAIIGIPASYRYPAFPPGGQPGAVFQWIEMEGPLLEPAWPPSSHRVLFDNLGVDIQSDTPQQTASKLVRRFASLAARGPVPEEALQKFERLVLARLAKNEPLREALLSTYQGILSSDIFLYLPEPVRPSDHHAIASRLAHFLTNSRPDSELLAQAQAAKLRDARVLRHQAERLLATPAFERFVNSFTNSWLSLRHVRRDDPDLRLYPEYRLDEYIIESMDRETRAFFTAMVRENLPATALVTADFIYANDRLARHYNLPPLSGSALRKVPLPKDSPFGGLLTQASILKVSANGSTTSPVLRGAWIMDRIIGEPPPAPPPGVPAVEPDIRGAKTIRDLLALHSKSPTCAACHAKFDPVGLALENFDIFGHWRTNYRGLEQGQRVTGIDQSGHDYSYTIANPVDPSGKLADGRAFQDIRELKAHFAANPRQLARNLLHQFTIYSTGVPVRFADRAEIESMLDACAPSGYRTRDLMLALVQSKIFLGPAGAK